MTQDAAVDAVIDQVSELLRQRIGLRPESTLRGRLRRGIRDETMLRHLDLEVYCNVLSTTPSALQSLYNRITVQETGFFRHPEHFEVLAKEILPGLPQPVRIWSAGCSNGQEAFTLAMVLEEQRIAGTIVATDLSTGALQRTAAGQYHDREIAGLSPARIARHLTRTDQGWAVAQNLRARVTTVHHNLVDPIPEQVRSSQVVFCRNVLIYFSPDHSRAFVNRLGTNLPHAAVFLGSAEAMWPISHRYDTIRTGETFYYRLRSGAGSVADLRPRIGPPRPGPVVGRERARPTTGATTGAGSAAPAPTASGPISPPAAPRPMTPTPTDPPAEPDSAEAVRLARTGQQALGVGDHAAAIVAFRKCSFLAPEDPLSHLHLGLALEAAGDLTSARRAFRAARHAATHSATDHVENAIGGYAESELIRLLDTKTQELGA